MRLKDQVAIVTGAGRGIGAALAKGLAREGAAVVVNYSRSAAAAEGVIRDIVAAGGRAVACQADISKLGDHERLVSAAVQHFGGLNILVNNAGIEYREPFLSTTEAQFDQTLAVNLKGVYFLSQAAARVMIRGGKGGRMINISSCHDTVPLNLRSAYAVSKGGLAMLTKSLALELAEHKINVTGLAPGAILTEMNRESLSQPKVRERLLRTIPLDRVGDVGDCVGAAIFLASREADYVTGTTLYVDGGLLLRQVK
jgi:glucose 1-dehydrogenase